MNIEWIDLNGEVQRAAVFAALFWEYYFSLVDLELCDVPIGKRDMGIRY